jgi:hypothetical protein
MPLIESNEPVAEIAAMFPASPCFVINEQIGTGQSQPFGERRGVPHEGAVVRRGMCCRANEHI